MTNKKIFAIGAAYGLIMRLIFGMWPMSSDNAFGRGLSANGPMMWSFVILVPMLIGIYTVYLLAREKPLKFSVAIFAPWLPTLCFVAGTAILLIEGSICIAMAIPIFFFCASFGGLLGYLLVHTTRAKPGAMNALLLLPFVTGYAEMHIPLPKETSQSVSSIQIESKPEVIWNLINHAVAIQPAEMKDGLAYMIGVPYPVEAITHVIPAADGHLGGEKRIRKLRWAKNVSFDEPITAWEENRYIKWTYAFRPDSFPPGALDEHVVIGGKYFDLIDTSYKLTPNGTGTRLDLVVNYRVSTNFNLYAAWLGEVLVQDATQNMLKFYKKRSEAGTGS